MGGTATDEAAVKTAGKGKNNSGKAATVTPALARKPPAGNKPTGKKSASRNRQPDESGTEKPRKKPARTGKQTPGKTTSKAQTAARKSAAPKTTVPPVVSGEAGADRTVPDEVTANSAGDDSRSLSWMSAQAVSALNAVKASQARKAESLLSRVEKPIPGKIGITELPEQTSEDLLEELSGMETAAAAVPNTVAAQENTTTSPASAGDIPTIQKEITVMQDKPDEQETSATPTAPGNATESTATTASANPEPGEMADTRAVVAAQAQQPGLPVRPIVATVFLVLLAVSGYRYWQENRDSILAPPPEADNYSETVKAVDWDDIPQQEAIAVVGSTPGATTAPPATAPEIAPQPDTAAADKPASNAAMEPSGSASTGDTRVLEAQPAADTAPPPVWQAEQEVPEAAGTVASETVQPAPAEPAASEPAQPESAAVAAPPARPVQPQPGYGAPGYGYYPQQPNWQQPYYQPGYPPQYPSR